MIRYAPFDEKQVRYIRRAQTSWLNVAEGGKRAGKNIINVLAWSMVLEYHPDRLHLAAGVSLSAAKMNILDSNGFGLEHIFAGRCRKAEYNDKQALYIRTMSGEKIVIVAGGRKSNDAAMIKGQTYGTAYITEVNECHQTFVQEVMDRTLSSSRRQIFMDLNPKPPRHWFYAEFLDYQDRLYQEGRNPHYNYGHFTITDNLSLSSKQLGTELEKYDQESVWYKADILGMRTAATGRIYTAYTRKSVSVTPAQIGAFRFIEFCVGIDVGGTDATAASLVGFTQNYREVVVIDGLYDRQGLNERMSEQNYVTRICDWLVVWASVFSRPMTVYVDSANKLFRVGLTREIQKRGMNRTGVRAVDKSDGINQRIQLNETLLQQGRFYIAESLRPWHDAYANAVWDAGAYEKGEWRRLDNGSFPVDCLDSIEYAFYPMARYLMDSGTV